MKDHNFKMGFMDFMSSAGGGGIFGSILGGISQERTNRQNKDLMKDQMRFQQYNSDTQYVRAAKDLKAAGINPILAGTFGGASTPAGALATMGSPIQGALTGAGTAKSIQESRFTEHKSAIAKAEAILKNNLIPASELAEKTAQAALDLISTATSDLDIKTTVNYIKQLSHKAGGDTVTWYLKTKEAALKILPDGKKAMIKKIFQLAAATEKAKTNIKNRLRKAITK